MNIHIKQRVLTEIYGIYDLFAQSMDVACKAGCSACCTQNVTLTSNEAYRVIQRLNSIGSLDLLHNRVDEPLRFKPALTTNQLADLCISGKEIPAEENHSLQSKCPLLANDLCSIYSDRPFGCRCFVSSQDCHKTGCADIDEFALTVNTVFMQFIEHIDTPGLSGNFIDMLLFFSLNSNIEAFEENMADQAASGLLPNKSISTFLVPPEHQARIRPILSALQGIKIPQS